MGSQNEGVSAHDWPSEQHETEHERECEADRGNLVPEPAETRRKACVGWVFLAFHGRKKNVGGLRLQLPSGVIRWESWI